MESIKAGLDNILGGMDRKNAASALPGPGGSGPNVALGQRMAQAFRPGWGSGQEWADLDALWQQESSWSNLASNPTSGAFGIPQAFPYTKMPKAAWPISAGGRADPVAQILWGLQYISGTYGDPIGAWGHEKAKGWYASGGPVGDQWSDEWSALSSAWSKGRTSWNDLLGDSYRGSPTARHVARGLAHMGQGWEDSWDVMAKGGSSPASLTHADWITLTMRTKSVSKALSDAARLHARHPLDYTNAVNRLGRLREQEADASAVWQQLFGGEGAGPAPGPPPVISSAPMSLPNVLSMITGGPSAASYYAGGGPVMPMLSPMPSVTAPSMSGLPAALGRAGGGAVSQPPQRRLAEGAVATGSAGSLFRDIIVQNPIPEPANASITRNVMRLAFLAGRGPV
jgi:hypothetical protein